MRSAARTSSTVDWERPRGGPRRSGRGPRRGVGAAARPGRACRRRSPRTAGAARPASRWASATSQTRHGRRRPGSRRGPPGPSARWVANSAGHVGEQPDPVGGDHGDPGAVVARARRRCTWRPCARPWAPRPRPTVGLATGSTSAPPSACGGPPADRVDEVGPPRRPGLRRGRPGVGLGERAQQVERLEVGDPLGDAGGRSRGRRGRAWSRSRRAAGASAPGCRPGRRERRRSPSGSRSPGRSARPRRCARSARPCRCRAAARPPSARRAGRRGGSARTPRCRSRRGAGRR